MSTVRRLARGLTLAVMVCLGLFAAVGFGYDLMSWAISVVR